jgi:hypothetical protein
MGADRDDDRRLVTDKPDDGFAQACKERAAQINASLATDQNISVAGPAPTTKSVFFATCRPKNP